MKDVTYCAATDCPSSDCKLKLEHNKFRPGDVISMANFCDVCRYYIGWVLSQIEEEEAANEQR